MKEDRDRKKENLRREWFIQYTTAIKAVQGTSPQWPTEKIVERSCALADAGLVEANKRFNK